MVKIARSSFNEVKVGRVTKGRERFVGFDWMWLISAPGVGLAIYVVQAKKMRLDNAQSYAYGSLKYPSNPPFQIDALQDFADWLGAIPLYCFYNYVDDSVARRYWHCSLPETPPQMGCTLIPLDAVRVVHDGTGKRDFRRLHQFQCAVPWRCLFHQKCNKFSFQRMAGSGSETMNRIQDDGPGRDATFEYLSDALAGDVDTIDLETAILQLNLRDLVDQYAQGKFVPFPERLALITMGNDP